MKLNGNGSTSTIGIVSSLVGILFAIFAILNARMDFLQSQIEEQKRLNEKFETTDKESLTDRSETKIKFTEVETQFKWFREISDSKDEVLNERLKKLEDRR